MNNQKKNKQLYFLKNEAEQLQLAGTIATKIPPGTIIFLQGDLGTGKTTFVRGFLRELGFTGNVKSPTYTLVEPYQIKDQIIYHFDLYRLTTPDELEYIGGRDYFDQQAICLIEWPEKAQGYLPDADLICQLNYAQKAGFRGRNCTLGTNSVLFETMIQQIFNLLD